jgi:hypothetical protein
MAESSLNVGFQAARTMTAVGRLNGLLLFGYYASLVGRIYDLLHGLTLHTVDHPFADSTPPFSTMEDARYWFVECCVHYWREADIKNLRLFWESPDDPVRLNAVLWGGWHGLL